MTHRTRRRVGTVVLAPDAAPATSALIRRFRLLIVTAVGTAVVASLSIVAPALRAADRAPVYYVSLGDSLAASLQPNGDTNHGYAEQLYHLLAAERSELRFVKLGCGGESTASMRHGTQDPSVVVSCATPQGYKNRYPKGTQLAQAVSFLKTHSDNVELVTIDLGGNDLLRIDAQGKVINCVLEPTGCASRTATMAKNLAVILRQLKAAAGPSVPIVGMTYDDIFAPLCISKASRMAVCHRLDAFNKILTDTYGAAGVPVADVAGTFENDNLPLAAGHVCAWTWFCSRDDYHPNTTGYGRIADAFRQAYSGLRGSSPPGVGSG